MSRDTGSAIALHAFIQETISAVRFILAAPIVLYCTGS
jgi:hypothetical protein